MTKIVKGFHNYPKGKDSMTIDDLVKWQEIEKQSVAAAKNRLHRAENQLAIIQYHLRQARYEQLKADRKEKRLAAKESTLNV
jgi:hypothetical protein